LGKRKSDRHGEARGRKGEGQRKRWPPTIRSSSARSFTYSLSTLSLSLSLSRFYSLFSLCAFNLPGGRQMFAPLPLDRTTHLSLPLAPSVLPPPPTPSSLQSPLPIPPAARPSPATVLHPYPPSSFYRLTLTIENLPCAEERARERAGRANGEFIADGNLDNTPRSLIEESPVYAGSRGRGRRKTDRPISRPRFF